MKKPQKFPSLVVFKSCSFQWFQKAGFKQFCHIKARYQTAEFLSIMASLLCILADPMGMPSH
jgi:hypothetical protein